MTSQKKSPGRPRSKKAREAVLRAAREMLAEGGLTAVTMEGLAARAGVGKPTIYRTWSNSHEVAMAALLEEAPLESEPSVADASLEALGEQLRRVVLLFSTALGRNVATMLAAADDDTEISRAFRSHFLQARREEGRKLLLKAIDSNDVRADIDIDVALDMIYGPVFYRLMMGHRQLDATFADSIIEHAIQGLRQNGSEKS